MCIRDSLMHVHFKFAFFHCERLVGLTLATGAEASRATPSVVVSWARADTTKCIRANALTALPDVCQRRQALQNMRVRCSCALVGGWCCLHEGVLQTLSC
eukprot:1300308-Alexandrium_andersonii.AAC.1